jgi:hypothetical protein
VGSAAVALAIPATRGARGVQDKPGWSLARVRAPSALVETATWLRAHAARDDVVQDARGDPQLILAAISERRPYVVRFWMPVAYGREEIESRSVTLDALLRASTAAELREIARRTGIRWMVLHPRDAPPWPEEVLGAPRFAAGGFRVFRLD